MKALAYEFINPDHVIDSDDFKFVEQFLVQTGRTQLGWHYIADITWIYGKVKAWPRSQKILDLGGGSGPIQYFLAELGFNVVNIDLVFVKPLAADTLRYKTQFEELKSFTNTDYAEHIAPLSSLKLMVKNSAWYRKYKSIGHAEKHAAWRKQAGLDEIPVGTIRRIRGNLCSMPEIANGSFDAAVSLSALEHIPLSELPKALAEVQRVLTQEAVCAITTSGTEQAETWFHQPSQGNCFAACDLEKIFGANPMTQQDPSDVMSKYKQCQYLKSHLADSYKKSDKNGMPLGVWDPKYIPVGIYSI